jgi:hypothetical protein
VGVMASSLGCDTSPKAITRDPNARRALRTTRSLSSGL